LGQSSDLVRHHCEAKSSFTGSRGFDGGIER
jgi:hypothetical protein